MWYRVGTVSITNGSAVVTGVGTNWIRQHDGWVMVTAASGTLHEIQSVDTATQITLKHPITDATQSGLEYFIIPTHSLTADLVDSVDAMIQIYSDTKTAWDTVYSDISAGVYQLWIDQGNTGTVQDFLDAIVGPQGIQGIQGLSAYEVWLNNGNVGTETDFLNWVSGQAIADAQAARDAAQASEAAAAASETASAASEIASAASEAAAAASATAASGSEAASAASELASAASEAAAAASATAASASETASAASEAASAASEANAAASETAAAGHASQTSSDLSAVAAIFDSFGDTYLGAKASDPTLDNDGNALVVGTIYWNTTASELRFYNGSAWEAPSAEAATSAAAANTAQVAAEAAQAASEAAEANAAASEGAATASATAASASETASAASEAASAASEANAAASETAAAASETNASAYADNALSARLAAEAALDSFDDRYLGAKSSEPTLDNDGAAILTGALFYDTTTVALKYYDGAAWNVFTSASGLFPNVVSAVSASNTEIDKLAGVTGSLWHTDNDGPGSGLNADLIDGYHETSFLRAKGRQVIDANATQWGVWGIDAASTNTPVEVDWGVLVDLYPGSADVGIQIAGDHGNALYFRGVYNLDTTPVWNDWVKIWHEGNDGPNSGLNADLLDGLHASNLVRGDNANNGQVIIRSDDADFAVSDATDAPSHFIWRDFSASKLYLGTPTAVPTTRADMVTEGGDAYWHAGNDGTLAKNNAAQTISGAWTFTNYPVIQGGSPMIKFADTDNHDFWTHVNGGNFYVLVDRTDSGSWGTPHPMQLDAVNNKAYAFGNEIWHTGNDGTLAKTNVDQTYSGKVTIASSGTIGGTSWAGGWLKIGSAAGGWSIDSNEMYNADTATISTLAGNLNIGAAVGVYLGQATYINNDPLYVGTGASVRFGGDNYRIFDNGSMTYFDSIRNGGEVVFRGKDAGGTTRNLMFFQDGSYIRMMYNSVEKLRTTSVGIDVYGEVRGDGDVYAGHDTFDTAQQAGGGVRLLENGGIIFQRSTALYSLSNAMELWYGAVVFNVKNNGNVNNTNNSYGAISDISLKENIVDANSQWDDIKAVQMRNFNFIDDPLDTPQLGVIAQEMELVSPGLVDTDPDTGLKSVKYSILNLKAVKALQEAMIRIEALEAAIAA